MRYRLLLAPLLAAVAALALPSLAAARVRHGVAPAVSVQRQSATPTPAALSATPSPRPLSPTATTSAADGGDSGNVSRYLVVGIVLVTLGAMVAVLAVLWWRAG